MYCSKAVGLIRDKGGVVSYYSLNDSKWVLDLFKKADIRTVPQIWDIEGNYIGGYQELAQHVEGV
jgi:glutaredoxin-related protein